MPATLKTWLTFSIDASGRGPKGRKLSILIGSSIRIVLEVGQCMHKGEICAKHVQAK